MSVILKKNVFNEDLRFGIQRFELKKPWSHPMHSHEGFSEFLYIAKGEMLMPMAETRMHLKEGDLILLRESDCHSLKTHSVLFYNVNFLYEDLISLARLVGYVDDVEDFYELKSSPVFQLRGFEKLEIENQLKRLFDHQREAYGDALLMKLLMSLLVNVVKEVKSEIIYKEAPPQWFLFIVESIDQKLESVVDVSDLAALGSRSAEHVSRSFKKYLGVTPSSYLNEKRLERASLRLASTNDEILAISMDLGFQNLNYFYKLFKEKYGVPPKEYRKKNGVGL